MATAVRYSTQILPDGDGAFEERIKLHDFATAADLEAALGAGETVLTQTRCPACGTRLKDVGKHLPVPVVLKGLLSCANLACPDRDTLRLQQGGNLLPISREEYWRHLNRAREVGRECLATR